MTLKEAIARDKVLRKLAHNEKRYGEISIFEDSPYYNDIFDVLMEEGLVEYYGQIPQTTYKGNVVIEGGGFVREHIGAFFVLVCSVVAAIASTISLLFQLFR